MSAGVAAEAKIGWAWLDLQLLNLRCAQVLWRTGCEHVSCRLFASVQDVPAPVPCQRVTAVLDLVARLSFLARDRDREGDRGYSRGRRGLQTGSGSRVFRLENRGQACWAPMMKGHAAKSLASATISTTPVCEAEGSPEGSGSGRSRSGSDLVVFFHEQQAKWRSLRRQASLDPHERLAVQTRSWGFMAEIPRADLDPRFAQLCREKQHLEPSWPGSLRPCTVWSEHVCTYMDVIWRMTWATLARERVRVRSRPHRRACIVAGAC